MTLCENITKCVEIIRTFRHFLVIDEEMSPMQPVFGKCLSSIGLSLSNFILMVRKNQITSTHMDINLRAKELHITSRTLDVPSWTTIEDFFLSLNRYLDFPRIWTIRFRIICFPESKVSNLIFLIFIIIYSYTRNHTFRIKMSELPIFLEFCNTIIDTSIFRKIGISFINESIDNLPHIWNKSRYRSYCISRKDMEFCTISKKSFCIKFGEFFETLF